MFLSSRLPPNSLQKLLDLMREKSEEMAQMQLLKNQGPTKAFPKRALGSQDRALQVLQRLRNSKVMHSSSCFGQRIDRIGSVSRLGCNGERLPCPFPESCTPIPSPGMPPLEAPRFAIWNACTALLPLADRLQDQGNLSGCIMVLTSPQVTPPSIRAVRGPAPQGVGCLLLPTPYKARAFLVHILQTELSKAKGTTNSLYRRN